MSYTRASSLHFTEFDKSQLLRMNLAEASKVKIAFTLKQERPNLTSQDAIFFADLLKATYKSGVIRGKVVKNA